MADKRSSRKTDSEKGQLDISFKGNNEEEQPERARYSYIPISYYWLKDVVKEFVARENFPDAMAVVFASLSVSVAFPFYPLIILIPILFATFIVTLYIPLLGLMLMLFQILPMFMYQAPLLAWIMVILMSLSLFIGHKHYRSITYVYTLAFLPMSFLGTYLEIPGFVIGVLFIGFRRAIASTIAIILIMTMLSGMTGIGLSAPFVYDANAVHSAIITANYSRYVTPSLALPALGAFPAAVGIAIGNFANLNVASQIFNGYNTAVAAITLSFWLVAVQIISWLIVVFAITNYVIKSRSGFKGTESSGFALIILAVYVTLSSFTRTAPNWALLISFVLAPLLIFALEFNSIEVVRSLSVMKQDFFGKFGDSFQDLTSGTKETLDDVANYDETKAELRQAVLGPIEHREISGAYKVKAAKGILLFGPPGTGKTLIMRALANEIRAKFFYVKTSSIVSPFQGESSQTLAKIFATVKKNTPAIIFFDEIDGIAGSREVQENDNNRQLLTTLLSEMDGFQKTEGVVVVGSTNVPKLLDPGIMRPGRFDKIIYMHLPDKTGRAKIFSHYLSKLPVSADISYSRLADQTSRYSGADIKNVCNEASRRVAEEAVKQHKVLEITTEDLVYVIKATKPSTSLASIERFNEFKIDYERRTHPELKVPDKNTTIKMDDVIGLGDAKKVLFEAIEIPILHPNLVKKYDVQNIKGILMFGPPGTGKTMLMKAVASELEGVNLITISGSDVAKNGLENALKTIKETFDRARENSPSILFMDELDALLPNRNEASELAVQVISEFLQQMDGIRNTGNVVLVGSTNRPDVIDPAILRPGRIDKFIFVPPPNREERAKIFELNLKKAPCEKDIDFMALADETEGYTGADIANICREAKMQALEGTITASKEKLIDISSILTIITNMKPSAPGSVLGRYMTFMSMYGGR